MEMGLSISGPIGRSRIFKGLRFGTSLPSGKNMLAVLWFILLIYPHAALTGPCPLALQKLDQYQGQGKKIIAVGGSDAHGFKMKAGILWVTVSPYETAFRCINVHVLCPTPLSGQVADDKYKIYHAIRQGQLWIAYDYFINSYGFRFFVEGEGKRWQMGDSLPFSSKLTGWVFTLNRLW